MEKLYLSSVTADPKKHWTEDLRRELMGEESNLEKRLIFSGTVNVPSFVPNIVAQPLPGVTLYDGLCINELDPEITIESTLKPKDSRTFRKILGLPEVPLSKVKRRRKTVKKALMAYGKSRDKAEEICRYISWSNGRVTYSDMCENLIDMLGR
jgi:hypothetical protein